MKTVLLLDDDDHIRRELKQILEIDYAGALVVLDAADGDEALVILEREPVDLLITDLMHPGPTGETLFLQARTLRPEVKIFVLDAGTCGPASMPMVDRYFRKPASAVEFFDGIEEVLGISATRMGRGDA